MMSLLTLLRLAVVAPVVMAAAQTCVVPSHGNTNVSDTPALVQAFNTCGNGGKIVFEEGVVYTLGELTVLTGCDHCEVVLDGTIRLSDNLAYWQSSNDTTMKFAFQDSISAFVLRGFNYAKIHSPKKTGVIDGAGQRWWNAFAGQEALDPKSLRRPILWTLWESQHVNVSDIHIKDSPNWNTFITESHDIEFSRVRVTAVSTNSNPPKNSDGYDTYRSSKIRILDSHLTLGDDCFSFKPNSTDITIKNLICEGTHGVSVGSLGQYKGTWDIVQDALIQNVTFIGGSNAVRIKTWGGDRGSVTVKNIRYKDIKVIGVSEAITVDACYFNLSAAECASTVPKVDISGVTVEDLTGTTSKTKVANIVCAGENGCDIKFKGVKLATTTGATPLYACKGITSASGIPCTQQF